MPSGTSSIEPPTSTNDQFDTAAEMPSTEKASDPDSTNSQDTKKLAGTLSAREDLPHILKIISVAKIFITIRISEEMLYIDLNCYFICCNYKLCVDS